MNKMFTIKFQKFIFYMLYLKCALDAQSALWLKDFAQSAFWSFFSLSEVMVMVFLSNDININV